MPEIAAAVAIVLAPAGLVLGWLAILAVLIAALSGAASGVRLVNPPPDRTDADRLAVSSR
jgi:hypothetical protein